MIVSRAATTPFAGALHADGPDPALGSKMELYAWLVGSWTFDVEVFLEDGRTHAGRGEIHAGWVLRGRAVQDVWLIRGPEPLPGAGNWYGTTLRVYDPALDAWRIHWSDPATNFFTRQIARPRGGDIVQEGPDPRGGAMRWTFFGIERDAFRWTAEKAPDGRTWCREVEIVARRA